jgi:predicted DsbA family dithiol-disulfide isomerase
VLLDTVKKVYKDEVQITWKNFQLEQVNSKQGPEWKVWDQPDLHKARSVVAAMAGEAARLQGPEGYDRFHLALLKARHGSETRIPLNEDEPILEVARQVGLDLGRLREDMGDPALLGIIAREHTESVEKYGVFGTPTFIFENGNSVYLKTFIPPEHDSVSFFEHFVALMAHRPYVGELKRPQPPWPKGAVRS